MYIAQVRHSRLTRPSEIPVQFKNCSLMDQHMLQLFFVLFLFYMPSSFSLHFKRSTSARMTSLLRLSGGDRTDESLSQEEIKLLYFDARGAAEVTRVLMKIGNIVFEDKRCSYICSYMHHTCANVYIYIYIHILIHTCANAYPDTFWRGEKMVKGSVRQISIKRRKMVHIYVHPSIHTYHIHIIMHTYIHTCLVIHVYIHIYIYVLTRNRKSLDEHESSTGASG